MLRRCAVCFLMLLAGALSGPAAAQGPIPAELTSDGRVVDGIAAQSYWSQQDQPCVISYYVECEDGTAPGYKVPFHHPLTS